MVAAEDEPKGNRRSARAAVGADRRFPRRAIRLRAASTTPGARCCRRYQGSRLHAYKPRLLPTHYPMPYLQSATFLLDLSITFTFAFFMRLLVATVIAAM